MKSLRYIMKSIRCNHLFVSNILKRFRMKYKRVITSSVGETTLQLCSESISLCSESTYSETTILRRSTHFTPLSSSVLLLWVFKATLSYNEKGEVKTRIWGHTWESDQGLQSERMTQIEMASASLSSFSGQSTSSTHLIKPNLCWKKKTQPSINAMQIFLAGTGSRSKWTVRPKEFNRIRFLIYYFVNICP